MTQEVDEYPNVHTWNQFNQYIPRKYPQIQELQSKKLFIGVPMYGGQCYGSFANSLLNLMGMCHQNGIAVQPYFLFNESLITRARNYITDEFLRSDCTHLLFIDSDIGFLPQQALYMLGIMNDDSPYDVLCGVYAKKTIALEKVIAAVNRGIGENDPNELLPFMGDMVYNPLPVDKGGSLMYDLTYPIEVLESGTGFMMIHRRAFDKYREFHGEEIMYKPDHTRSENFDGSREIGMYFQAGIDPWHGTKRYLSEDYWFCQGLRMAGGRVWIHAGIDLTHTGSYIFTGSIKAMASLNISTTADETSKPKKKK